METQQGLRPVEVDARACFSSYLMLCSIWVLLAAVRGYIGVRSTRPDWRPVWFCISVAAGLAIWLERFRLVVTSGVLTYRTLFKRRSVRLEELGKAEIATFSTSKGDNQALLLYPSSPSSATIKVNVKVFSRADITRLFDILGDKLHSPRELGIYVKQKF